MAFFLIHPVDWENAKIVAKEQKCTQRKYLEGIETIPLKNQGIQPLNSYNQLEQWQSVIYSFLDEWRQIIWRQLRIQCNVRQLIRLVINRTVIILKVRRRRLLQSVENSLKIKINFICLLHKEVERNGSEKKMLKEYLLTQVGHADAKPIYRSTFHLQLVMSTSQY